MKLLDFTAIDFETANSHRGSPCQVGLVKVRNGRVVNEQNWLIQPPEAVRYFDSFNVSLHGIDSNTVKDASTWRSVAGDIETFVDGDTLVAHNAGFDIGVIRDACAFDKIQHPTLRFVCTMVISRRVLSLPSYRLPYVAEELGVDMGTHHDALDDALGAAQVALGLASRCDSESLEELLEAVRVSTGSLVAGQYKGSVSRRSRPTTRLALSDIDPDADPDGFFYGQVVVFTGALATMTRQEAWDVVARSGGIPAERPTRKTNVLVIGGINPNQLAPGATLTAKAARAFTLQQKGQDIEVMTEADFLQQISLA